MNYTKNSDKLTTKSYWETYYKSNHANKKHIEAVCSVYDSFWSRFIRKNSQGKSIIEIGGFPGRFLAYLSHKYHLKPTCLDYNSDTTQIEATFKIMGVNHFEILQKDFTQFSTDKTYDYVSSNGFIEHFEDYDAILDTHVSYMKKQSRLMVMIPNMRGYIQFYKYLVDFKNLKIHNLKCMKLQVFKAFAKRHDLKIKYLDYYGGFPYTIHQKQTIFQKIIYKIHRLVALKILNPYLKNHPSRFFSSSIIAIFEK